VVLELEPTSPVPFFDERHLVHLGAHVAASLAEVPYNARDAYLQEFALTCAAKLGGIQQALSAAETRGIRLLGPVIALLEREIPDWPADDRRSLWALVRAKGAKQEREFARLSRRHARFWHALHVLLAPSGHRP
jgi:hypothetical protein